MVEIHQVDYLDDISKGFVDGGDRSIKSLLRHSETSQYNYTPIKPLKEQNLRDKKLNIKIAEKLLSQEQKQSSSRP